MHHRLMLNDTDIFIQKLDSPSEQLDHAGLRVRTWTIVTPWWQGHTICSYNYPHFIRVELGWLVDPRARKVTVSFWVSVALSRALGLFIPSQAWSNIFSYHCTIQPPIPGDSLCHLSSLKFDHTWRKTCKLVIYQTERFDGKLWSQTLLSYLWELFQP